MFKKTARFMTLAALIALAGEKSISNGKNESLPLEQISQEAILADSKSVFRNIHKYMPDAHLSNGLTVPGNTISGKMQYKKTVWYWIGFIDSTEFEYHIVDEQDGKPYLLGKDGCKNFDLTMDYHKKLYVWQNPLFDPKKNYQILNPQTLDEY